MRARSLTATLVAVIATSIGACAAQPPAPIAPPAPATAAGSQVYDHTFRPSATPPFAPLSSHISEKVSVTEVTVTLVMPSGAKAPLTMRVGDSLPVSVTVHSSGGPTSTASVQFQNAIGSLVVVDLADTVDARTRVTTAIREVRVRGFQIGAAA